MARPAMEFLCYVVVLFTALSGGCRAASTLKEIEASRPDVFNTTAVTPAECGTIPPVPVDLAINAYYKDSSYGEGKPGRSSIADLFLLKKHQDATRALEEFSRKINSLANKYQRSGDAQAGECAVAFIDEWARGNALLGEMKTINSPNQSAYHQKWLLASAATAYFQVQQLAAPGQDARIKWWMTQVTRPVKAFWRENHKKNNHYIWSAAAVMQVSVLTGDRNNLEWAREAFNYMANEVREDGFMRYELERGKLSLHYHAFTLAPMLYMAQLSKMLGEDWSKDDRLQQLMDTVFANTTDPTRYSNLGRRTSGTAP